MQGAPKRQLNAEEMLAELKRALESSTRTPDAPPTPASTAPKSSSPRREPRRSHWGIDPPIKASADSSVGKPTDLQKSMKPGSHRRKLTAAGLALGGAAAFFAGAALMNQALNRPAHGFSAAAPEEPVTPRDEQALQPPRDSRSPTQDSQRAAPLQAGDLETRPDASAAPANNGPASALAKAEVDTPSLTSSDLETAAPAPAPLSSAAVWVPAQRIGPDGTPFATAPSAPASTASAPPLAETSKPPAPSAAPQLVRPDKASIPTAPPAPASTASAPPPAQTPKPNATQTASVSNESAEPSTPKTDSKRRPHEKPSAPKPAKGAKASAKSAASVKRQSSQPAPPKEADSAPHPAQDTGNPTAAAPVAAPSVPQRLADGMTHAFGYLAHLPGALIPRLGGSNPDAH